MGALYEDVEKFFGDIFAYYGRFLARYPVVFILLSLLTSCLLGMGLLNLEYETSVEKLYTPMGSPAVKDQEKLALLFPDHTADNFSTHQQIFLDTYGDIIVTMPEESDNVLTEDVVAEVRALYREIRDITLEQNDRGHTYDQLCASWNGNCVVDGSILLDMLNEELCIHPNDTLAVIDDRLKTENLREVLGGVGANNGCMTAQALHIRFNLRHDTAHQRQLGVLWELKFVEKLQETDPVFVQLHYTTSESLDLELNEHTGKDTKFFALTIIIMMIYSTFVSAGGNWVSTRVLLAQAGLIAALLAILASFGLLSMCGMKFVDICGVMPFLVLGVGVDDMFILMSGWRQTDLKAPIEDRISETFRSSAISVTITSLTDLLAFCIGATSPFLSVKNFCIYTGVAIFWCYINQLTFFGGCLVLHARRVEQSRHCLTCMRTKSRAELQEEGHSRVWILACSGHPSRKAGEDDSPCEKIPSSVLPKTLLYGPTKIIIIVGFIVYFAIAIWGGSKIKTGLKLESVVPETSYVADYYDVKQKFFSNQGGAVMFVVEEPVNYHDPEVQNAISRVFYKAKKTGYIDEKVQISWLDDYIRYQVEYNLSQSKEDFVPILLKEFLPKHPQYQHDIVLAEDKTNIRASRFYVTSKRFEDSTDEGNMMLAMRHIAGNCTVPMIAYSPYFIYYEHYVSILKNTLLAVGVAIIGMLFVALMFIPHPISVTCVTITMVTIVLGMFGFMHFWGLALSAITTVQIILSVGFCVDFTVHISHAFMTATGKNRNERVMAALEKVGVPMLNGAFSSILGILMLAFASSYIFKSFFKTMLLVIMLGLAHSLLLLPVVLSFIGPRRTSKPRMFIPISSQGTRDKLQSEQAERGRLERQASVKVDNPEMPAIPEGFEAVELVQLPEFTERGQLLDLDQGPSASHAEPSSVAASIYSGSRQASEDLDGLDIQSVTSSKSKDLSLPLSRGRSLASEPSVEESAEEPKQKAVEETDKPEDDAKET